MVITPQFVCVSGEEGLQRAGTALIYLVCIFLQIKVFSDIPGDEEFWLERDNCSVYFSYC